jgi:ribosomal protein S21
LWTATNMPPHIRSESVFREMKLRSHYGKPSESKTRERQGEEHEKTAQRVAIGSAPEDKKA